MDYSELQKKRRAVRDYEDKEVPFDVLMQIINESSEVHRGQGPEGRCGVNPPENRSR